MSKFNPAKQASQSIIDAFLEFSEIPTQDIDKLIQVMETYLKHLVDLQMQFDKNTSIRIYKSPDEYLRWSKGKKKDIGIEEHKPLLEAVDMCKFLRISRLTLTRLKKKKIIPYIKMGNAHRFILDDVLA